jgi:hypothetical protein
VEPLTSTSARAGVSPWTSKGPDPNALIQRSRPARIGGPGFLSFGRSDKVRSMRFLPGPASKRGENKPVNNNPPDARRFRLASARRTHSPPRTLVGNAGREVHFCLMRK